MVGHLYDGPDDPRRDGGFTVFYMGINIGAFAAPLVIGTVGEKVNWHLGFALAALGMALGLAQFLLGSRHLDARSQRRPDAAVRRGEVRDAAQGGDLGGRRGSLLRVRRLLGPLHAELGAWFR